MLKRILASFLIATGLLMPIAVQANVTKGPFSFTQGSFDFYYSIGGSMPTSQSLEFEHTTNGGITYALSVPNQPSWLNASYNTDTTVLYPNTPSGLGAAVNVEGLAIGEYTTNIYLSGNFTGSPVKVPVNLHITASGTSQPSNAVHPEGTNVKTPDGTVFRIANGSRTPYTSAGGFLSYGYNSWSDVKDASSGDLKLTAGTCSYADGSGNHPCYIAPRDGSLINDKGTIYIVTDNYRIGFASADAFLGLGYQFKNALAGDTSFLSTLAPINSSQIAHPSGTVVNDRGTICVIASPFREAGVRGRKCYSNLADMNSWGIRDYEILPANSYDVEMPVIGVISARTAYSMMNP